MDAGSEARPVGPHNRYDTFGTVELDISEVVTLLSEKLELRFVRLARHYVRSTLYVTDPGVGLPYFSVQTNDRDSDHELLEPTFPEDCVIVSVAMASDDVRRVLIEAVGLSLWRTEAWEP